MGVEESVCMKGGTDETSYSNNSILQRSLIRKVRPLLEENIRAIFTTTRPKCLNLADLGCSTGPNTFLVLQSIIDAAISTCQSSGIRIPEFNAYMNDLPQNDFNTIFKSLPSFYKKIEEDKGTEISCFVSGTPGSFYSRLFPTNSLHFVHCATSLHFLSQVPKEIVIEKDGKEVSLNREGIYANKGSPPEVLKAYTQQFAKDFTLFLSCRSQEIANGGRILLNIPCTQDDEVNPVLEFTYAALNKLASQGRIEKEKLEAFNLPMHYATIKQLVELIEAEGSFVIEKKEVCSISWNDAFKTKAETGEQVDIQPSEVVKFISSTMRAGLETMLKIEFGEEIVEPFFMFVQDFIFKDLANVGNTGAFTLALSLIRRL